ncbi:MAG: hypothetical protein ACPHN2_04660 [Sinimarinibacterium flocculans]|uniref:hypothetical protein n=1 Tax=Sinimarinibacterium flocculans TaxID=985250 RepID=UPI003C5FA894
MPIKRADITVQIRAPDRDTGIAITRLLNEVLRDEGLRRIRVEDPDGAAFFEHADMERLKGKRIGISISTEVMP